MQRLLRSGDFAKLAKVNKKTLMYYDEIGLFQPIHINEKGYRYYGFYQLDRLALIMVLKDLGMELKEISNYLQSKDTQYLKETLIKKREDIDKKIESLEKSRLLLLNYQENLDIEKYENKSFEIKYYDEIKYDISGSWDPEKKGGFIINYITDGPYTGTIVHDEELILYHKTDEGKYSFPKGKYLVFYGTKTYLLTSKVIKAELEQFCLAHHFDTEGELRIEYNDIILGNQNVDYYQAIIKIKDL